MPARLSHHAVLDSDSDREGEEVDASASTHHTAPAAEATPPQVDDPDDSSASESTGKLAKTKRGRKPKPKLPSAPSADEDRGKHKRFEWSNYPAEVEFLQKELDDIIATADSKQRHQKKAALKTRFLDEYGVLGEYTKEAFEGILNNWLKNHLQFSNLRKVRSTLPTAAPVEVKDGKSRAHGATTSAQPHSSVPSAATAQPLDLAPLLQTIRKHAHGPSALWAHENGEIVKPLHAELGGTIGDYKTAVHQLYTALPETEKAVWEAKAAEAKEKVSQDELQCFKNQTGFPLVVANLIGSFFGHQPEQVGSGLAHLRMALRNESGGIDHDQYTIGLGEEVPSFDLYAGGPSQNEIDRWGEYVDDYLPKNPVHRDAKLAYEADGLPKLPAYNDEWTVAEARAALDAWFHAMWVYAGEKGTDLPHGLDWSNFQTAVAPHVPSRWRADITSKPSDRPFHRILTLYNDLFEAQDTADAFRWIPSASSSTMMPLPTNHDAPPQTPSTRNGNHAPPQTPSRRMHTLYTTPTKPALSVRDQPPDSACARPLPSLAIPSLETIRDEDDAMGPTPASSDPEPDCDNRERGGADAGVAGHGEGDADADAMPRDTSASRPDLLDDLDKAPAASEPVGSGAGDSSATHDADEATMKEDSGVPVEDSAMTPALEVTNADGEGGATMEGEGESGVPAELLVTTPAQEVGDAHGDDTDANANPVIPTRSKRKRQERLPESMTKRTKSTIKTQAEGVSGASRRSARSKLAPPVTPLKTRARAQREACEASETVVSTRQTRGRKSKA